MKGERVDDDKVLVSRREIEAVIDGLMERDNFAGEHSVFNRMSNAFTVHRDGIKTAVARLRALLPREETLEEAVEWYLHRHASVPPGYGPFDRLRAALRRRKEQEK